MATSRKYIYLYKITNLINNRFYIGIHGTDDLNDWYFGSGTYLRQAVRKYGRKNFKKEILEYFDTYEEASKREAEIVDEEFVSRRDTYNSELGGKGGKVWTPELKEKMSVTQKTAFANGRVIHNKGIKITNPATLEKMKLVMTGRFIGEKNPMYGKKIKDYMTPEAFAEHNKKISIANKKPKLHKEKYREYAKKRFWIVNKDNILKHCLNINDSRLISGEYRRGKKWVAEGDF